MINLSLSGLGATGPLKINPNDPVKVSLNLPYNDEYIELNIESRLVHSTPVRGQFLIGLAFEKLSSHQQRIISNFINGHTKSEL